MVFVCVSIRTKKSVLKKWYARTVLDSGKLLSDVFGEFASGTFDDGKPIDDAYQTTQVSLQMQFCVCVLNSCKPKY